MEYVIVSFLLVVVGVLFGAGMMYLHIVSRLGLVRPAAPVKHVRLWDDPPCPNLGRKLAG